MMTKVCHIRIPLFTVLMFSTLTGCFNGTVKFSASGFNSKSGAQKGKVSLSGSLTGVVGTCLKYTASSLDSQGKAESMKSSATLSLSGSQFYSDSSCTNSITFTSIAANSSEATFYFKDTKAGAITLSALLSDGKTGSLGVTLSGAAADHLVESSNPLSGTVGTAIKIVPQVVDQYGNGISGVSLNFALTTGGGSLSSATVASDSAGLAENNFTLGTVAGTENNSVTVSPATPLPDLAGSGQTSLLFVESAVAGPADPAYTTLALPSPMSAGASVTVSIILHDSYDNPLIGVLPQLASATGAIITQPSTSTDSLGQTTGTIMSTQVGTTSVYISSPIGLDTLVASSSVGPGPASTFAFSNPTPFSPSSGGCTQININTKDSFGNTSSVSGTLTINLSATGGTTSFYSNSGCTTTISAVSISSGLSAKSLWFKDTQAEYLTLTGNSTGAFSASNSSASIPVSTTLTLTGPASAAAGTCAGPFTISSPQVISASTSTLLDLTKTNTNNIDAHFFSNPTCTAWISTSTIPANTTSSTFYFKSARVLSSAFTATLSPPNPLFNSPASLNHNVTTGSPVKLILTGPTYVPPSTCTTYKVTTLDSGNNVVNNATALTVNMTTAGSSSLYSDSGCLTSLTGSVSIPISGNSTSLYFKDSIQENITISASATGLTSASFPLSVTESPTSVEVALGITHSCALVNGAVKCWGNGASGQLGNGASIVSLEPVTAISSGATAVSAGQWFTCGIVASGGVQCWGNGADGRLGRGTNASTNTPVSVTGLNSGATLISAGGQHACAVVDGGVQCWGRNDNGQLGNNSYTGSNVPVSVLPPGSGVTAVSASWDHTCAVVNSAAYCWGLNTDSQVGVGSAGGKYSTPQPVSGLTSGVTTISAGYKFSCAVVSGGVKCWGLNGGNLGDGNACGATCDTPVTTFPAASGIISISAGYAHACALNSSGLVKCWGANNLAGQIGDGTTTFRTTPVQVTGLGTGSGVTQVSVSMADDSSCAVIGSNLKCWGNNRDGNLGIGAYLSPAANFSTTPIWPVSIFVSSP